MKENYIIGTTVPFNPPKVFINDYGKTDICIKQMKEAGLNYARNYCVFPWADKSMKTLDTYYVEFKKSVKQHADLGIQTLGVIQNPGQMGGDSEGQVSYLRQYPDWMGPTDQDYYFEILAIACEFIAKDMKNDIIYWQIANEQDNEAFIGELTLEQNERWMLVAANAVKRGNPNAIIGTNMSCINEKKDNHEIGGYTLELINKIYNCENSLYDFLGIDGYFGSWTPGGAESWVKYIDDAYAACHKPILIQEWGYSTLQEGPERTEEDKNRFFNTDVCRNRSWGMDGLHLWNGQPHSEELQCEYIKQCAKIFFEHPHCIGQMFFQWTDQQVCWQCGSAECPAECGWGCIHADETPKPGYYALAEVNKIYRLDNMRNKIFRF